MKIKTNDKVIVITGKDKGKEGVVVRALPREDKVIVEGVNIVKKHVKSRQSGKKGDIINKTMPIHVSNVKLVKESAKSAPKAKAEKAPAKKAPAKK